MRVLWANLSKNIPTQHFKNNRGKNPFYGAPNALYRAQFCPRLTNGARITLLILHDLSFSRLTRFGNLWLDTMDTISGFSGKSFVRIVQEKRFRKS